MRETDGTLSPPEPGGRTCSTCHEPMTVQTWESNDGAFEDFKYTCPNGHVEWVDGIDS
jgi:hypothetical protein